MVKTNKTLGKKEKYIVDPYEGFSFGSERGQIKRLSDHSHIIPLYDFGVGTYDFDMTKVVPMMQLAQDEAKIAVENYFK